MSGTSPKDQRQKRETGLRNSAPGARCSIPIPCRDNGCPLVGFRKSPALIQRLITPYPTLTEAKVACGGGHLM
jgi:hypothetical protein